ncbi:MAG: HNH endonuclease [Actinomycetota bacterium]|nr:HNH endonuclease [Actinomycetota bacterium]
MFEELKDVEQRLAREVHELDPDVLEPSAATTLVEMFSKIERLAAAGKALAARRVTSSGVWRKSGERSAAHWMARSTGSSVGHAVALLETVQRLEDLPATDRAMRSGELSEAQVVEISSAAAESPSSEATLLAVAGNEGLAALRESCARVRAAATDESGRHDAIHRRRALRHWTDPAGTFRLDGRLTPESGAVVLAALEPYKERIFERARKDGRRESYEAYAADALVEMAEHVRRCPSEPDRSAPSALVHVRVDHSALVRGSVQEGETCEIPGVGPVPVASAKALASDALIAAVMADGADVRSVTHLGRTIPARLRTALQERDPTCVVPGCSERRNLEIDHIVPFSEGGPTCLDNLARLCRWHHHQKTHSGYRLTGRPGRWRWEAPEGVFRSRGPSRSRVTATNVRAGASNAIPLSS